MLLLCMVFQTSYYVFIRSTTAKVCLHTLVLSDAAICAFHDTPFYNPINGFAATRLAVAKAVRRVPLLSAMLRVCPSGVWNRVWHAAG